MQESKKEVLMVDAGDLLFKKFAGPVPENELKTATQKAHLIVESLNLMGYHALGIGDDDLTPGKDFLVEISKKAKFPFLSSNLFDEASGKPLFQPYLIKEIQGLKIGIFSLLSPDFFLNPADPRMKGVLIRSPMETVNQVLKELQPRVNFILLLSHLGYTKDMELAQNVPGIHLIVGGHTGMNLSYAPVIKNTILLQTASKGMYAGRMDLTLSSKELTFYNVVSKQRLETNLNHLKSKLALPGLPEGEKPQLLRSSEQAERTLAQFKGKNEFTNVILPLNDGIKDHPDIQKMVEEHKLRYPEPGKSVPMK